MTSLEKRITVSELVQLSELAQKAASYEKGLETIRDFGFWDYQNPTCPPVTEGFTEAEIADMYLASGRLMGFYGLIYHTAQETSKNLLTTAYYKFLDLGLAEKQLVCSNYLALSYWRMGQFSEADDWLEHSLSFDFPAENPNRLHAFIVESLIKLPQKKYAEIFARLSREEENFLQCGDSYLIGLFYMNRGIAKEFLLDFDGSLNDQMQARDIFQSSGHWQLLSYAENNLACYYLAKGEYKLAYDYAMRALKVAKSASDYRQIGCVYDTLALIAFDKKDYLTALLCAEKAIAELQKTECYGYLIEYYETKIQILLKIHQLNDALETYAEALAIARANAPEYVCKRLTQTISEHIEENHFVKIYSEGHIASTRDNTTLYFEPGFEPVGEVDCVEVHTNRCHAVGLEKGRLVVIDKVETTNGDFVAVCSGLESQNKSVHFGFVDEFLDLIKLETGPDDENPILFSANVATVLGKVIGYCSDEIDKNGRLRVVPLRDLNTNL